MKGGILLLILILSTVLIACKASQKNQKVANDASDESYWMQVNHAEDASLNYPSKYMVYTLNTTAFKSAIADGEVLLPDDIGGLNMHSVEENSVMSQELAAKFPNIKSYSGRQISNSLCENRVNLKEEKIEIAVFCNNKTYYIKQVFSKGNTFYIVYNKMNAPEGAGTVNE